jgi:hypothetical protein
VQREGHVVLARLELDECDRDAPGVHALDDVRT